MTLPAVTTVVLGAALETTAFFTPLGIRFWDIALDAPVQDGLQVTAIHASGRYPPVRARRSQSGVYAFHDLPLLREIEHPRDEVDVTTLVPRHDFVITVEDMLGRYLPYLFVVRLPLTYRGVFLSELVGSPLGEPGRAYLFSAPTRSAPSGMAAVRADVWDQAAGEPAAFAALYVTIEGRTVVGIADEFGRVLVLIPYPTLEQLRFTSPPTEGLRPVDETSWEVSVRVAYPPAGPPPLEAASHDAVPAAWRRMPSLKSILIAPDVPIWGTESGPPEMTLTGQFLTYGEELILRTAGSPALRSRLAVRGTSPL